MIGQVKTPSSLLSKIQSANAIDASEPIMNTSHRLVHVEAVLIVRLRYCSFFLSQINNSVFAIVTISHHFLYGMSEPVSVQHL